MGNKNNFNIDIKALANNEKAIEILLNDYARLHETLADRQSDPNDDKNLIREILNSSENAILVTKNLDEIIDCNDQFLELFSVSEEIQNSASNFDAALAGMYEAKCFEMLTKQDIEQDAFLETAYKIANLAKEAPQTLKMADGKSLKYTIRQISDDTCVHSYIDITKEAEGEQELKRVEQTVSFDHGGYETSHSQIYDALEVLDDGFVLYDKDDKLVACNSAFKKQFGVIGDEIKVGETYEALTYKVAYSGIVPNIEGKEDEFVKKLVEQRKTEEGIEKTFQTHDGQWIRQRDKRSSSGDLVGLRTNVTELKQREEELAKASRLFENTTENMAQGIAVFENHSLQFYNARLLDLLNVSSDDIQLEYTFEEFINALKNKGHYNNNDEIAQRNIEMMLSGKVHTVERKTHYNTHLRIDVVPRGEGDIILTYTDITDIKKREEELEFERSEHETTYLRHKKIANALAQGIIMFEKEKVVFFNQQALDTLELSEDILFEEQTFEGFLAAQVADGHFGTQEEGQEFANQHMNIVAIGIPYQLEQYTKSGRTIRLDGVPSKQDNSLVLTFTDITNSKEHELELKEAKDEAERASRIQSAWTNVMVPGLIIFDNNKLSYLNPRTLELLGANEDSFTIGMPINDVIAVQATLGDFSDKSADEEYQKKLKEDIKQGKGYSFERHMKNGKILHVDGVPIENNGLVVSYTDITEVKEREKELKETMRLAESAERAKSEFLANMSHEIRTPMNGVMGMAELLASTELDTKQKMFTDVIVKSGASLLTIINDILDFSKIDAGQMELDPAPFNLREAIEDVATLVSSKVAEKDLELIVRVDPALPKTMVGDVGRIRQIITNLLGNAVKFTEKGHVFVNIEGEVTKIGDESIAGLKFSIEDTGIGIPEEKCTQVFQKFSQVDTSATRKHEGTGLGLSISSSLVKLMGGDIGVESKVGEGSTFWFTTELPVHSEEEIKQVIPGDMTGARVLVIDDNAVNRSILAEQMAAWNFDGASTSTGAQGLEVMRNVIANGMSLDLVILDYQMPEMSGAEVLETMRKDEALKDIPVVMLTSVDSSQTNQRLSQLGAEANLTKPTRSSMLLETILQVIANKRADVKTGSISNLTAKPTRDTTDIELHKQQPTQAVKKASEGLDILVAEDNEVNQIVFRQILEETNLNFEIVDNGRLALAAYKAQKPRLILMDVSMPEMNGKEATTAIRKYERDNKMKRTPIVGVTAHALKGDMESCIDAGMDDYLSKPVSPNKLSLKIEQWLKINLGNAITG